MAKKIDILRLKINKEKLAARKKKQLEIDCQEVFVEIKNNCGCSLEDFLNIAARIGAGEDKKDMHRYFIEVIENAKKEKECRK